MRENQFFTNFRDLRQNLNLNTVSAAVVTATFGCTGPALIIISGATNGGLTYEQMISWLFAIYFFSGLLGIYLALKYHPCKRLYGCRSSISCRFLTHFSLTEAIAIANLIVLILGVSGLIDKVMKWMPIPIVMGMIVGVMIKFAIEMVTSITISPLLAGSAIGAFFVLIIGMSGVSSFHINAPLWAIIGGLLVSFLIEKEH